MESYIRFNTGSSIYWSNKMKCEYVQRNIIVHSILYYELSESVIDDKMFDLICKQLLELEKQTKNYNQTEYYYVFKDFKGETGYYIWDRLKEFDKMYLKLIALNVLKNYKEGGYHEK